MNETIKCGETTYVRAEIALTKQQDILDFLAATKFGHFSVENENASRRVSASSLLGLLYASSEFGRLFFVNEDVPDYIPPFVNSFRPQSIC